MTNSFYTHGSATPANQTRGTSSTMRAEFDAIVTGFDGVQTLSDEVVAGRQGQASLATNMALKAPLASPTFTGVPSGPTAAPGTNTTQFATMAALATAVAGATGGTGLLTLTVSNAAAVSLVNGQHDAGTYSGGVITWTLPAAPVAGHTIAVTPCNGRIDNVIARNGNNIMSLAEDLTINSAYVTVTLRYVNSTVGWRLA